MNTAQLLEAGNGLVDQSAPQGPSAGASTPVAPAGGPASFTKAAFGGPAWSNFDKNLKSIPKPTPDPTAKLPMLQRRPTAAEISTEQGFDAPDGPQIKNPGIVAPIQAGFRGIGGATAGTIGNILGGIGQIGGNITDLTGLTSDAGAAWKGGRVPYQQMVERGSHQFLHPRTSKAQDEYVNTLFGGDTKIDPERHAAGRLTGFDDKTKPPTAWEGKARDLARFGEATANIAPYTARLPIGRGGPALTPAQNAKMFTNVPGLQPLLNRLLPAGSRYAYTGAATYPADILSNLAGMHEERSPEKQVYQRLSPEQQTALHQHERSGIDARSTGEQRDAAQKSAYRRLLTGDKSVLEALPPQPKQLAGPSIDPLQVNPQKAMEYIQQNPKFMPVINMVVGGQMQSIDPELYQRATAELLPAFVSQYPQFAQYPDQAQAAVAQYMGKPELRDQLLQKHGSPELMQALEDYTLEQTVYVADAMQRLKAQGVAFPTPQQLHQQLGWDDPGMEKQQHDIKGIFKEAVEPLPIPAGEEFLQGGAQQAPVPPVDMPQAGPDPNVQPPVQMPQAVPDPDVPPPVQMPQEVPPAGQLGPEADVPQAPAPGPEPGVPPGAAQAPGPEAQQPAQEPLPADLPHRPGAAPGAGPVADPMEAGRQAAQAQTPQYDDTWINQNLMDPESFRAHFTKTRASILDGTLAEGPERDAAVEKSLKSGAAMIASQSDNPTQALGEIMAKINDDNLMDADDMYRMYGARAEELGLNPQDPETWTIFGYELPQMNDWQKLGLFLGVGALIGGLGSAVFGGGGTGSLITALLGGAGAAWASGAFDQFLGEGGGLGLPGQQEQPGAAPGAPPAQESIVGQAEAAATEAAPAAPATAPEAGAGPAVPAPAPAPEAGVEVVAPADAEGPAAEPDDQDLMTQLNVNNPWIRRYGGKDNMLNSEEEVQDLVEAWLKDPQMDPLVKRLAGQMSPEIKQQIIAGLQAQNKGVTGMFMDDERVNVMIQMLQS